MKGRYETKKVLSQTGGLAYAYMPIIHAKSNRFSSKVYSAKPQFDSWSCLCCDKDILNNISQRGMKREKCDECKKETDRLINTIRYWEKIVGVNILNA